MLNPFLSAEDYDERAHELYNEGEYDRALDVLRDGLERYPDAVDLHVGLGFVRLAREEFAWARSSFGAALEYDPEHEDAWVGIGETLLKFGRPEDALACFARVDELGLADDLELGLAIGRALYREGLFRESRQRLAAVVINHPDAAEARAALAYTLHALGDSVAARRELRTALRLDGAFHEARIYLSHLLFECGDHPAALRELECVPPDEHWDPLSLWRFIDLKCSIDRSDETDPALAPWRSRLAELDAEPNAIDHLLAEVETAFEHGGNVLPSLRQTSTSAAEIPVTTGSAGGSGTEASCRAPQRVHRVRTVDGAVFVGTWEEILIRMRDALSDPGEPLATFMTRAAQQVRSLTGCQLPCDDPESFLRESARIGLLRIEA